MTRTSTPAWVPEAVELHLRGRSYREIIGMLGLGFSPALVRRHVRRALKVGVLHPLTREDVDLLRKGRDSSLPLYYAGNRHKSSSEGVTPSIYDPPHEAPCNERWSLHLSPENSIFANGYARRWFCPGCRAYLADQRLQVINTLTVYLGWLGAAEFSRAIRRKAMREASTIRVSFESLRDILVASSAPVVGLQEMTHLDATSQLRGFAIDVEVKRWSGRREWHYEKSVLGATHLAFNLSRTEALAAVRDAGYQFGIPVEDPPAVVLSKIQARTGVIELGWEYE